MSLWWRWVYDNVNFWRFFDVCLKRWWRIFQGKRHRNDLKLTSIWWKPILNVVEYWHLPNWFSRLDIRGRDYLSLTVKTFSFLSLSHHFCFSEVFNRMIKWWLVPIFSSTVFVFLFANMEMSVILCENLLSVVCIHGM